MSTHLTTRLGAAALAVTITLSIVSTVFGIAESYSLAAASSGRDASPPAASRGFEAASAPAT
jgi:hypothetical protein